jgi:hypothetical protein
MKWEYLIVDTRDVQWGDDYRTIGSVFALREHLDDLGNEGWEIVSAVGAPPTEEGQIAWVHMLIFLKRPALRL